MINFDHFLGFSGLLHLIASEIKGNPFRNCLTNAFYSELSRKHDFCSQLLDDQNKVPFNVLRNLIVRYNNFNRTVPKNTRNEFLFMTSSAMNRTIVFQKGTLLFCSSTQHAMESNKSCNWVNL